MGHHFVPNITKELSNNSRIQRNLSLCKAVILLC